MCVQIPGAFWILPLCRADVSRLKLFKAYTVNGTLRLRI